MDAAVSPGHDVVVIGLQGRPPRARPIRIAAHPTIRAMQRRHWPFTGRPTARPWPQLVRSSTAPASRRADRHRTEEDQAERELMVLVAVATVAITAASAAVTYLLV
jgi:hypothetical protein